MPKSGEHKVNYIDSFFRQRPSISSVREGETMKKFIIHRTARRKADDVVIEAKNESDAFDQMWNMANEGLFGVWNE